MSSTLTTMTRPSTAAGARGPQVGFAELCRLALRQHRIGILCGVVCYLALTLMLLYRRPIPVTYGFALHPEELVPVLAGVIAAFWGAPLLANEYERHTNVLAWSQDASPTRWLLAKITVLGSVGAVMTVLVTLAQERSVGTFEVYWNGFEAAIPLALGYAAFGFTLGIAVGAVVRRVAPAMAATLVVFGGLRFLVAAYVRPLLFAHLVTPLRWVAPITAQDSPNGSPGGFSLELSYDYLNASGQQVAYPENAFPDGNITEDTYFRIMHQHGITQYAIGYQPQGRVATFQLAELAIFLVLTAIAVWVAFRAIRRA